ncbi:hypothetical protein DCF75_11830 [Edwardsiella tarda]|uniref:hypothetical protein n=1 Tax=Edwardsiella tarda TaxID=636 RepID=UPI0013FDB89C|nr:hypothetical protein [Edwardsiella tarda]UCQ53425.1 hypothetical protein DCF75_11830 [Edwardsiella tarda]
MTQSPHSDYRQIDALKAEINEQLWMIEMDLRPDRQPASPAHPTGTAPTPRRSATPTRR